MIASIHNRKVNSSILRPAACPRDPEIQCQSEIHGSRGQAAGRRMRYLPSDSDRMKAGSQGFTLIEVLIALSVFAILASITSSAMYQAFNTREHVTVQANRLNSLQLAVAIINRDIQQIVERSVLGNELHHFPAFTGQRDYIEFTRGGIINPTGMNRRGTLQRVAYLCKKNRLYRRSWNVLDGPNRNQYQDKLILDNLSQCQFNFLAHNLQTLPRWQEYALQQNQRNETLPTSIQLAVNLNDWGKMSLSFIIPEALYAE